MSEQDHQQQPPARHAWPLENNDIYQQDEGSDEDRSNFQPPEALRAGTTLAERKKMQSQQKQQQQSGAPSNFGGLYEGLKIGQDGKLVYEEAKLDEIIFNQLGFSFSNYHKDNDDEEKLRNMKEFEREEIYDERQKQCEMIRDKLYLKLEQNEAQIKAELMKNIQMAGNNRGRGQRHTPSIAVPRRIQKSQSGSRRGSRSGSYSSSGSSSSGSNSSSGSSSSGSSNSSSYSRRSSLNNGRQRTYSEDAEFEMHQNGQKVVASIVTQEIPSWAKQQEVEVKKESPYIMSLGELKKVILKRHHLEKWVDQEFNFFYKFVVGAFVKILDKQKMRIAFIEDCRDNEDMPSYKLIDGKKNTTIQLFVRYGQQTMWINIDRISNQEPEDDEFRRMWQMFNLGGIPKTEEVKKDDSHESPNLRYLKKESINIKSTNLQTTFKEGPPKYDDEQRRAMIMRNVERKLNQGLGGSLNLQQLKIDLISEITGFERIKDSAKTSKEEDKQKLQAKLDYLNELLEKIEKGIQENKIKNARTIKVGKDEDGKNIVQNIEEVESNMAMLEYMQKQEQRLRHPEMKVNNFFMQHVGSGALERTESLSLQKQESLLGKRSNALSLEEELMKIQVENQHWKEMSKKETCYQRIKRIKTAQEEFHRKYFDNASFQEDSIFRDILAQSNLHVSDSLIPLLTKPLAKPHPSWQKDFEAKQMDHLMRTTPQNAKFVTFEEYIVNK